MIRDQYFRELITFIQRSFMKSIFNDQDKNELLGRIEQLSPANPALLGEDEREPNAHSLQRRT
jgi:hypothetical protein